MESIASFNIPDEIVEDFNNILYVDDESSNLRVFDSVFCRYYNVYTANNGQTAINMLRQYDIHMIITDQKMPEMTGTDLLEKTLAEFPDIIRIILTGFADIQAIIKAINKCSIYKYITKPYENSEMREIIDKGLQIYNMREKKYSGTPLFSNKVATGTQEDEEQTEAEVRLSELILNDVKPNKEYYEMFVEHVISYQFREKNPLLFKDFFVHADEDSSAIYQISYKLQPSKNNPLIYLHLKHRLRSILETKGNKVPLNELLADMEEFYLKTKSDIKISNINIHSYNWDTKALRCLTKDKKTRVYSVNDRLEEITMRQIDNFADGYLMYGLDNLDTFMLYGWDFELQSGASESDLAHNINQIIANAINLPFDLQESQIGKGINSISSNYNDFTLFGIYIND
ncbi:MAG: response regulator [Cyclobacteriaceae bacterium]